MAIRVKNRRRLIFACLFYRGLHEEDDGCEASERGVGEVEMLPERGLMMIAVSQCCVCQCFLKGIYYLAVVEFSTALINTPL